MSSYNGLTCPPGSQFYVCDNIAANTERNPFIGCCKADPCVAGTGCNDKFSATFDPGIWKKIPPQACSENAKWWACPNGSFLGCCDAGPDPCQNPGSCAGHTQWGRLSNDAGQRNAFVSLANGNKVGGAASTTTTTSTSPPVSTSPASASSTRSARPSASSSSAAHGTSAAPPGPAQSASPAPLSTGGVAGIAVGSAAAGLLLGLLAAFFLFRRRQRRRSSPPEYVHMPYAPGKGEKDLPDVPGAAAAAGDEVRLEQFLLAPKPDHEMATELGSLGALIQQHVENHYHQQPVPQGAKPLTQALAALGFASGRRTSSSSSSSSPEALVSRALDARTRFAALQHVIARVAFDSVVLAPPGSSSSSFSSSSAAAAGGPPVSLLPPAVAAFARSVPATERHRGNSEAVEAALTKWRQLSAFLLHPHRSDRTPLAPAEEATAPQARQLARALNRFLAPFALHGGGGGGGEQESHLQQVLAECARFGYVLFSQPAEYRFAYDGRGRRPGGLVVCPGLERVRDEEGRRYTPPQVLAAPVEEA